MFLLWGIPRVLQLFYIVWRSTVDTTLKMNLLFKYLFNTLLKRKGKILPRTYSEGSEEE